MVVSLFAKVNCQEMAMGYYSYSLHVYGFVNTMPQPTIGPPLIMKLSTPVVRIPKVR